MATPVKVADEKPKITSDYMDIAQLKFVSKMGDEQAKAKLLTMIKDREMAPFYKSTCEELGWPLDQALLTAMEAANAAEMEKLAAKLADAETNEGETEVREALLARTDFLVRIGENAKAVAAHDETYKKTVAMGLRLDLLLSKVRVGLFFEDMKLALETIEKAKKLLEEGGDWERRNRLKVYEAVYFIMIRDFKKASALLLDSVATFTATELLTYNHFVLFTVVSCIIALPRAELKSKVVDAPEILQVLHEIPGLGGLINGLYSCQYKVLMRSLVDVCDSLKTDRYFRNHVRYYWREVRVLAYTQLLESYRSVSLASMAATFGVSAEFLDQELSTFISAGRLSCNIDKVGGIVCSTRPDSKNAQYQATLKQGDMLLNRVQKLSRVINM
uniref:PCI domain-containing protein n=1 Tax=Haptolina ericina TaxID=156174 RepID=A0A7S3F1D2_9EUKA|mmetsp:Transcript_45173/g.102008  ORF Transcript_45173/g.102008 Transcript_45173/m.102008 type:complete len:388 (+) Transcript_45173:69-1232(+)